MYDPFAQPPAPGMVAATAVPQVMPNPVPVMTPGGGGTGAPLQANNALAGLLGRFPGLGTMQGGGFGQGFRQQLGDWRDLRPDRQTFAPVAGGPQDYRSALMDWRGQRPTFRSYAAGPVPPTGVMPINPTPGV
jgi:hypothetical protein